MGALKSERAAIEQRRLAEQRRSIAEKQTAGAERNAGLAHATMDALLSNIAGDLRRLEGMKLEMGRDILARIEAAVGSLVSHTEDTPPMLARQAALFRRISETYFSFGDLTHAVEYAQKQTAISRELVTKHPGDLDRQYGLAASLNYEGEALRRQGDYKAARANYREALSIGRQFASKNPQSLVWRASVVASLRGIGDILRAQGDTAGALTVQRESLDLGRTIVDSSSENEKSGAADSDPSAVRWQSDLVDDLDRIADFLQSQAESEAALSAYRNELDMARRLAGRNNSQAQRQVSVVLTKLGFVYGAQGDFATSIALCGEAADATHALIHKNQNNAELQMDLVASLHCLARAGDKPHDRWTEALAILSQLQSEQRIPPAKHGWIAAIKRDLHKSEHKDLKPGANATQRTSQNK
jgi:tetratricopeptide (TPR) repeat protein